MPVLAGKLTDNRRLSVSSTETNGRSLNRGPESITTASFILQSVQVTLHSCKGSRKADDVVVN